MKPYFHSQGGKVTFGNTLCTFNLTALSLIGYFNVSIREVFYFSLGGVPKLDVLCIIFSEHEVLIVSSCFDTGRQPVVGHCSPGYMVKIVAVFYGHSANGTCQYTDGDCTQADFINHSCVGQQICEVNLPTGNMGRVIPHCQLASTYLQMSYQCIPGKELYPYVNCTIEVLYCYTVTTGKQTETRLSTSVHITGTSISLSDLTLVVQMLELTTSNVITNFCLKKIKLILIFTLIYQEIESIFLLAISRLHIHHCP